MTVFVRMIAAALAAGFVVACATPAPPPPADPAPIVRKG